MLLPPLCAAWVAEAEADAADDTAFGQEEARPLTAATAAAVEEGAAEDAWGAGWAGCVEGAERTGPAEAAGAEGTEQTYMKELRRVRPSFGLPTLDQTVRLCLVGPKIWLPAVCTGIHGI